MTAAAGNSAGKKKLLIGVGATVGVCAIGAALWFFVFKKDDAESGEGKTLAEFIKDKRIYTSKKVRGKAKAVTYQFIQFNADGTCQNGVADGKGNTVLPPMLSGWVQRYEVEGLTVKIKLTMGGMGSGESALKFPKPEISEGDKVEFTMVVKDVTIKNNGKKQVKEQTVLKVTSGPFKPSINVAGKGRPGGPPGNRPGGGSQGGSDISNSFKAFLKKVDKNKDGRIGKDEVAQIPQWRNLFGQVDRNKDGTISLGEYIIYIARIRNGGGAKGSPKGGKSRPGVRPQGRPQPR